MTETTKHKDSKTRQSRVKCQHPVVTEPSKFLYTRLLCGFRARTGNTDHSFENFDFLFDDGGIRGFNHLLLLDDFHRTHLTGHRIATTTHHCKMTLAQRRAGEDFIAKLYASTITSQAQEARASIMEISQREE